MHRSRLVTVLLALVLATAAAGGVFTLVNETQPEGSAVQAAKTPTPVPTAGVLVASQDIAAGTLLTREMVEVKEIPVELRHARVLSDPDQVVGKMAAVALVTGEQILDTRITSTQVSTTNSFAGTVPVGKRAISVVFDEVIGAGALVQPGDHVDVLAFFELDVTDFTFTPPDEASADDSGDGDSKDDEPDYTQYVSVYVVQDVQVLAVSQALTPDQVGVDGQAALPTPTVDGTTDASADDSETPEPVARPAAKSVTLAVTPEQAQRLMLASQTVKNEKGSLRLAMRAPGDTTVVELGPAQLGTIPVGDLLGDINVPMVPSDVVITHAEFTERILASGGVLEFSVTVKNVSDETITSGTDAPPGYEYSQGVAYDALGFFPEDNSYRLGLNFAGSYPNPFPYRWGLGQDLAPGESVEITGSVRLTEPTPATRYWFGIVHENGTVTQDGVGVAEISVVPSEAGTVRPATAELLSTPSGSAEVVAELAKGDEVVILAARGAWFQVRAGENEGWVEAADIRVPRLGADTAESVASPVAMQQVP